MKFCNLVGKKFGRLIVISIVGRTRSKKVLYACLCSCGSKKEVVGAHLISGNTKSCGCFRKERATSVAIKNEHGSVYGRLTVLSYVGVRKHRAYWRCLCSCGTITEIASSHLRSGHTKSCGCLQKEHAKKQCISFSKIYKGSKSPAWRGGITPLYAQIRDSLKNIDWRLSVFKKDFYTCVCCGDNSGGNLCAHHLKKFSHIIKENKIKNIVEAEKCTFLWDVKNGITLCKKCHILVHRKQL